MAVRMPGPEDIRLTPLSPDRPLVSYRGGIAAQGAEDVGRAIAGAGQEIASVGSQFQRAQDEVALSGANSAFLQQKLRLDEQYRDNPDPEKYAEDLQTAANDTAQSIQNIPQREMFLNHAAEVTAYGAQEQQKRAHRLAALADQGYAKQSFYNTVDALVRAPGEAMRVGLISAFDGSVDALVAKGSLTPAQAVTMKHDLRVQYATSKAETLVNTDPAAAAHLLTPGAAPAAPGLHSDLTIGIHRAALAHDVPADWLTRTAYLESGYDRNTGPSSAGASGDFQLMPAVAAHYGVDASDPAGAADATARLYNDNLPVLRKALGRMPTPAEMYLAHQQGAAGALALIQHPDEKAADALAPFYRSRAAAQSAITGNGGQAGETAGDFTAMWQNRWNMTPGTPAPQSAGADQKSGDWRDFLPPDVRSELQLRATRLAREQDTARLVDAERAQRLQAEAAKAASDRAEGHAVADIMGVGTNAQITAQQIADPTGPYKDLTPAARMRMIGFMQKHTGEDVPAGVSHQTAANLLSDMRDGTMHDMTPIYDAYTHGHLSNADFNFLQGQFEHSRSPDGQRLDQVEQQFLKAVKPTIDKSNPLMGTLDMTGGTLFFQLQQDLAQKIAAYRKAGKDPFDLFDPSKPDYVGKSGALAPYQKSIAESMNEAEQRMLADQRRGERQKQGQAAGPSVWGEFWNWVDGGSGDGKAKGAPGAAETPQAPPPPAGSAQHRPTLDQIFRSPTPPANEEGDKNVRRTLH